jgi:hypothetical protein
VEWGGVEWSECEGGGRERRGGRGADTELKTKIPHVNVGNKDNSKSSSRK